MVALLRLYAYNPFSVTGFQTHTIHTHTIYRLHNTRALTLEQLQKNGLESVKAETSKLE